jgi:hypothetical protein
MEKKLKKLDADLKALLVSKTEGDIEDFEAKVGKSLYEATFGTSNDKDMRKNLCEFYGITDELRRSKPAFQITLLIYESYNVQMGIIEDEETKN